ncbi:F420H2 dehydrogenase [Methanococcoides methylutens]|uniref:F420H2 dehydrogenase n=1 Tax=Methanococcoides methylutens TaxID=2226 RepID=A0A099T1E7_METMT|nr:F420H2 dehydrogenase subunit FpoO [Methanococcoides methylutens]KGK98041.1 F420H2 dehydrogenase [Methanococcoides methylutens]
MADCDLCGVAIPTVCPVKVFSPKFDISYPEGVWKGLCGGCLEKAKKAHDEATESKAAGTFGKCDLCGTKAQLQDVEINIPSFSKGYEIERKKICMKCLEQSSEAYENKDELLGEHH